MIQLQFLNKQKKKKMLLNKNVMFDQIKIWWQNKILMKALRYPLVCFLPILRLERDQLKCVVKMKLATLFTWRKWNKPSVSINGSDQTILHPVRKKQHGLTSPLTLAWVELTVKTVQVKHNNIISGYHLVLYFSYAHVSWS